MFLIVDYSHPKKVLGVAGSYQTAWQLQAEQNVTTEILELDASHMFDQFALLFRRTPMEPKE